VAGPLTQPSCVDRTLTVVTDRAAWSTAGGVVLTVAAGAAITVGLAAAPAHSGVASWPSYVFGVVALAGLYVLVAPLAGWWPFAAPGSVAQLLDERIRAGRDARERIIYNALKPLEEAGEAGLWILRTANGLHEHYPAIADRFLLASGDESQFSGQALLIQNLNAKLAVLTEARQGIPS
jgi:hypothetical protein